MKCNAWLASRFVSPLRLGSGDIRSGGALMGTRTDVDVDVEGVKMDWLRRLPFEICRTFHVAFELSGPGFIRITTIMRPLNPFPPMICFLWFRKGFVIESIHLDFGDPSPKLRWQKRKLTQVLR